MSSPKSTSASPSIDLSSIFQNVCLEIAVQPIVQEPTNQPLIKEVLAQMVNKFTISQDESLHLLQPSETIEHLLGAKLIEILVEENTIVGNIQSYKYIDEIDIIDGTTFSCCSSYFSQVFRTIAK